MIQRPPQRYSDAEPTPRQAKILDSTCDPKEAPLGTLNAPTELVVGVSGNVFVADQNNNRIEKFDRTGRFLLNLHQVFDFLRDQVFAAWPVQSGHIAIEAASLIARESPRSRDNSGNAGGSISTQSMEAANLH